MPTVCEEIEVRAPHSVVFSRSNDLERWPEVMSEYDRVTITDREGPKLTFRIEHSSGASWESSRFLFPELGLALAERGTPRAPFLYMHIVWTYRALEGDRTMMMWTMQFELPESSVSDETSWVARLRDHTRANMAAMKEDIERYHSGHRVAP